MTNKIQENKIIAMQAIIFLSLLLMLSFILDGCAIREEMIDRIEVKGDPLGDKNFVDDFLLTIT